MIASHRRHDILDKVWVVLKPLLSGEKGCVGKPVKDNRLFINSIFWILRTGDSWRD